MSSISKWGSKTKKPHAVCIPYPAQGHVSPMLTLAKLLHHRGFHITFVNSDYNHKRLLRTQGPIALKGLPDFRFESIPDGLPPSDDDDVTQDIVSLCLSTRDTCLAPFRELLSKLDDDEEVPPVTCIVSDFLMTFTIDAAEEIGVPDVMLWGPSACGLLAFKHYRQLVERGYTPLKDESYFTNGYLESTIDWIPGMKNIRLRDIPSFIRTTDPNDVMIDYVIEVMERSSRASAIIMNSFFALENDALEALSSIYPTKVLPIGPLQFLLNQIPQHPDLKSIGSNLWKEQSECLDWLDTKDPGSVVYVNFGSITVLTLQQLVEFAWGLANSKKTFLWIIRPDLVRGDSAMLPEDFLAETEARSLLANWCPQEKVLSHPSIGGFLTHNGWNSTLESIYSGVPMICWPFFTEQQTNCRYVCKEWGVGMEIDADAKSDEIEKLVRELMDGEKGKEMKNRILELKNKSEEAAKSPNGSSYMNFEVLIKEVLLQKHKRAH